MKPLCGHENGEHTPDTNHVCWLYLHDQAYNHLWGGTGAVPAKSNPWANDNSNPSPVVVEYIKPSPEVAETRKKICLTCPQYRPEGHRCAACGCVKPYPVWEYPTCPLNKWNGKPITAVEEMKDQILMSQPGRWRKESGPVIDSAFTELLTEEANKPLTHARGIGGEPNRGIVIAAGGAKYFTCAWVCVTILRHLGCQLPIQFWYLGEQELDPYMARLVEKLGVECIDASKLKHQPRILAGWELKVFSVLNSPFNEVLFLDSDNVPVKDPTYLFDDPRYKRTGAIFWPDLPPHDRKEWIPETVWKNFGMDYNTARAFESGQLLVNKTKCQRELDLCMWVNGFSDYYYQQVYGDKDTWLLSWHKVAAVLGRSPSYSIPNTPAGWISGGGAGAIVQHDFEGQRVFQHRCQPNSTKWSLTQPNSKVHGFFHEEECFRSLEELKTVWKGTLWHNYHPTDEEREFAGTLTGKKFHYIRSVPGDVGRTLELLGGSGAGGRIGQGAAECEVRWEVFKIDGEFRLAICREDRLTCLYKWAGDKWFGVWVEFEKCATTLKEIPVCWP